ncbi:hypothetical protein ACHAWF_009403 [Thalassiosira exigua]
MRASDSPGDVDGKLTEGGASARRNDGTCDGQTTPPPSTTSRTGWRIRVGRRQSGVGPSFSDPRSNADPCRPLPRPPPHSKVTLALVRGEEATP